TVGNVYDTTADIYKPGVTAPQFREFVTMLQDNVYLSTGNNFMSVNFGVEPFLLPKNVATSRYTGYLSSMPAPCINNGVYEPNCIDLSLTFSNSLPVNPSAGAATSGRPQTPIFSAVAGTPIRFRMLHPDGLGAFPDNVFTLHGHVWQEEPYIADASQNPSAVLGNNTMSQWMGARDGFGSGNHWDMLLPSAGGVNAKAGDYLYQSLPVQEGGAGIWGIFRVLPKGGAIAAAVAAVPPALPAPKVSAQQAPAEDPGKRFLRPRDKKPDGTSST